MSGMSHLLRWSMFGPVLGFKTPTEGRVSPDPDWQFHSIQSPWCHDVMWPASQAGLMLSNFNASDARLLDEKYPLQVHRVGKWIWKGSLPTWVACFCVCSFAGEGSSIGLGIHFRGVASFGPQDEHVDFFCRREKQPNIERNWNFCPETIWSADGTDLVQCLMQLEKI